MADEIAREVGLDATAVGEIESHIAALEKQVGPSSIPLREIRSNASAVQQAMPPLQTFTDRFDWRQTAASFRQLRLSPQAKLRKTPSATLFRTSNQQSRHLRERIRAYQERLTYVVGLERAHERAEWDKLRSRSVEELVVGGWAMDELVGYWSGGAGPASSLASNSSKSNRLSKKQQQTMIAKAKPKMAVFNRTGLQKLGWSRLKEGDKVELTPSASAGKTVQDYMPEEELFLASLPLPSGKGKAKAIEVDELVESEPFRLSATVVSIDAYRLRLQFNPPHSLADIEGCPSWRLDIAPNDTIDVKVDEAIKTLTTDVVGLEKRDPTGRYELQGTSLIEALLPKGETSSKTVEAATQSSLSSIFEPDLRIRSWCERYARSDSLVMEGDPDLSLNASQLKAVATMLGNRLSLIQGPPGTGKTHTLVSTIKLLKQHFAVPHPVLLTAHTNVAVDNLIEGALKAGLKVVRVGPVTGIKEAEVEEVTLEKKMEQHPMATKLEEIKIKLAIVKRKLASIYSSSEQDRRAGIEAQQVAEEILLQAGEDGATTEAADMDKKRAPLDSMQLEQVASLRRSLGRLAQQSYMLTRHIQSDVLHQADVVCSTLLSSSSASLRCIDFPLVFIDESTQALEVLSLLPMIKGARQVALIGDHKQLPPVLKSRECKQEGGGKSLFERLIEEDGWGHHDLAQGEEMPVSTRRTEMQMLQVQHRMHPTLAAFPNEQFYAGQLQSAPRTKDIAAIAHSLSAKNSSSSRLVFLDHPGQETISRSASEVSLMNPREIELLMHLLCDLLERNDASLLSGSSIGIVTPYLAQSRAISKILRPATDSDVRHPLRRAVEQRLTLCGKVTELEKIEVNTVDGFQGREKDVIIFSAVRCGKTKKATTTSEDRKFNVGFLADERRLNVALTRAKAALFVLGNLKTWENATASNSSPPKARAAEDVALPSTTSSADTAASGQALRSFVAHLKEQQERDPSSAGGIIVSAEKLREAVPLDLPSTRTAVAKRSKEEQINSVELEVMAEEAAQMLPEEEAIPQDWATEPDAEGQSFDDSSASIGFGTVFK